VAILLATALAGCEDLKLRERNRELEVELAKLRESSERLAGRADSFLDARGITSPLQVIGAHQLRDLERKGIRDPLKTIPERLRARTDVVPANRSGNPWTYRFEKIVLLSPQWVYATAENGHYEGTLLLEYRVAGPDSLTWTVIASDFP
jgi:hypothetical protein